MILQDKLASRLNIDSTYGGLGDQIARLPAFKQTILEYPHIFITIYVHDFTVEIVRTALKLALPNSYNYQVMPTSMWDTRTINHTWELSFEGVNINSLKMPLTHHAHLFTRNEVVLDPEKHRYLSIPVDGSLRAVQEPYVVITTGYTAKVREFRAPVINQIIRYLRKQGITPVLLGSHSANAGRDGEITATFDDKIRADLTVDLRNKTYLMTCFHYLGNAKAVLGVDNGLLHLASMSPTNVIWAFTTVRPEHRLPLRQAGNNFVIEPSSKCRYCQSDSYYVLHDFRKCFYNTFDCTKSLTAKPFIDILEKLTKEAQ
jgi:hypothetical protein